MKMIQFFVVKGASVSWQDLLIDIDIFDPSLYGFIGPCVWLISSYNNKQCFIRIICQISIDNNINQHNAIGRPI